MKTPLLIFGSKGASKEAYYIAKDIGEEFDFLGFVESDESLVGEVVTDGKRIIASDKSLRGVIEPYSKVALIIPFGSGKLKEKIKNSFADCKNVIFPNLVHPSTIVSNLVLGEGNIIAPGAVIACDSKIGNFNLINRCATVGHDVIIGDYSAMCPGSVISGTVIIGNKCSIGANATVLQGLKIGDETIVGAGAVVTKDTEGFETLVGIPAQRMKDGK